VSHVFGEAFGFEAFGFQIGNRFQSPIIDHYVSAILLIYASGQGSSTVLGLGLLRLLILLLILISLLRPGIRGWKSRKRPGGQCQQREET